MNSLDAQPGVPDRFGWLAFADKWLTGRSRRLGGTALATLLPFLTTTAGHPQDLPVPRNATWQPNGPTDPTQEVEHEGTPLEGGGSSLVIPAAQFADDGGLPNSANFEFVTGRLAGTQLGYGCVMAPVYLPNEVTVEGLVATVIDVDTQNNIEVSLRKVDSFSGETALMASAISNGSPGLTTIGDTTINDPSVVHPDDALYVETCLPSSDISILSVRIDYIASAAPPARDDNVVPNPMAARPIELTRLAGGAVSVVPAAAFTSDGIEPQSQLFGQTAGLMSGNNSGLGCVKARVHVRDRFDISHFSVSVVDDNPKSDLFFNLYRVDNFHSGSQVLASVVSSGSSEDLQVLSDSTILNPTIDQLNYSYYIAGCFQGPFLSILSARVFYEILFEDGFESGDLAGWDSASGGSFSMRDPGDASVLGATKVSVISTADFRDDGLNPDSSFFSFLTGTLQGTAESDGCSMAPVYLPDGVTVTKASATLVDNDSNFNAIVRLRKINASTGDGVTMATITTSGTPGLLTSTRFDITDPSVSLPDDVLYLTSCVLSPNVKIVSARVFFEVDRQPRLSFARDSVLPYSPAR